jgi:two-component system chemotaxis response regulator CheY
MGYRVLAVDDSLLMHKTIERTLSETEFELVGQAKDGQEGVELFESLRPDVVLMDIVMPKLTGKDALREILGLDSAAKVIMISSLGTDDAVTECLQAGARRFIQKPFDSDQLLNAMRSVLRSP